MSILLFNYGQADITPEEPVLLAGNETGKKDRVHPETKSGRKDIPYNPGRAQRIYSQYSQRDKT